MHPGDRLVCAFVQPTQVGESFTDWPLHITIVPWFRVDTSTVKLVKLLSSRIGMIGEVNAVARSEARFGRQGTKRVNLVGPVAPFKGLEHGIREVLHGLEAWLVDETTAHKREFRPHVTHQEPGHITEGDTFVCRSLYIVEQLGDHKQVIAEIPLAS